MSDGKFDISINGYNTEQVDSYIEELKNELICANIRSETLSGENKALRNEILSIIRALSQKLEEVDEPSNKAAEKDNQTIKDFEDFGKELESIKALLG